MIFLKFQVKKETTRVKVMVEVRWSVKTMDSLNWPDWSHGVSVAVELMCPASTSRSPRSLDGSTKLLALTISRFFSTSQLLLELTRTLFSSSSFLLKDPHLYLTDAFVQSPSIICAFCDIAIVSIFTCNLQAIQLIPLFFVNTLSNFISKLVLGLKSCLGLSVDIQIIKIYQTIKIDAQRRFEWLWISFQMQWNDEPACQFETATLFLDGQKMNSFRAFQHRKKLIRPQNMNHVPSNCHCSKRNTNEISRRCAKTGKAFCKQNLSAKGFEMNFEVIARTKSQNRSDQIASNGLNASKTDWFQSKQTGT